MLTSLSSNTLMLPPPPPRSTSIQTLHVNISQLIYHCSSQSPSVHGGFVLRVIGKGDGGRITVLVGRCLHVPCVILVTATKFAKIMFLHLSVSHSVHWGGGSASRRVCIWGVCIHGGRGSASCGGGRLGRHPSPRYHGIRSTSGRYASYWNAFLFKIFLSFFLDGSSILTSFWLNPVSRFFCIKTHSHPLKRPRVHNQKLPTINRFVQERYTKFAWGLVYTYRISHCFVSGTLDLFDVFYVMCKQHQRNAFNPFSNSEKNRAKTLRVNQALSQYLYTFSRSDSQLRMFQSSAHSIKFHKKINVLNSGGSRISKGAGAYLKGGDANLVFWPFFPKIV